MNHKVFVGVALTLAVAVGAARLDAAQLNEAQLNEARRPATPDEFTPPDHGILRVEARLRMPEGTGTGAFSFGDVEIVTHTGTTSTIGGAVHCRTKCQDGFHTYRLEWDRSVAPDQLRWYVDGAQVAVLTSSARPESKTIRLTGMMIDYVTVWTHGSGAPRP